jgi:CheY-like chemotaxis protein
MLDAAKFETALLNLVVNARDATPDGGSIAITTGRVDLQAGEVGELGAGSYVAIAVQDSGAGMSADVVARAIEPFFTTKEVGKGTGLGLSQVYGMVRQSGGDLSIHSRQGQGTTITMYFPVLSGHSESSRHEGDSADKVLIVDDQPDVLEVTCELFRSLGFEVLAANSGEDAIDVLKRTPGIHLMLSDVVMPGMNGVQLGRKAQELVPGLKVILASGFANPAVAAKEDSLQGFEFLPKPYRVGDVVKRLRTLG